MSENVGAIEYTCSIELSNFMRDKRKLEEGLHDVEKSGESLNLALGKVAQAVKVLAAAFAVVKLTQVSDEMRLLEARVNVAAGSMEKGATALSEINKIASATQTSVATIAGSFSRLNGTMLDLGRTQRDTLELTELVAKAVKVSGASTQEAAAAQQQFAQALGAGKLNGDELRSILENAPYLARKIAEGMGVQIGALRELGEEGKLTSQVVIDALSKAADSISKDFEQLPLTFDAAFQALQDSSTRGIKALDDMSGTSTVLTGITTGLSEAINSVVFVLERTGQESTKLSRNEGVKSWASITKEAMYDIADAAQVVYETLSVLGRNVVFVFKGIGTEIGGIAAQAAAVARGDFSEAAAIGDMMKADAEKRRAELDAADARTLSTKKKWSEQMRQADADSAAWDAANAANGRGGKGGGGGGGGGSSGKPKKESRDFLGDMEDKFAKRVSDYGDRNQNAMDRADEKAAQDAAREAERKAQEQARGQQQATNFVNQSIDAVATPEARIEDKYAADLAKLEEFNAAKLLTEQQYADAQFAIAQLRDQKLSELDAQREEAERQRMSAMLMGASQSFGAMAEIVGTFAGKQSGAYKAMFAVSKAFAIADATIKLHGAIMNANFSAPWPSNFAAMATVASAGAGVLASIKGASFGGGRQFGGPVSAGTMYRVNETGRPEMFTSNTGAQYMLPTANGSVTPANKVGGGGAGGAQQAQPNVTLSPVFQGVQMPDGWFAVRPEAVVKALETAYRDGHRANFMG